MKTDVKQLSNPTTPFKGFSRSARTLLAFTAAAFAVSANASLILRYDFDDGAGTVAAADSSGFGAPANGTFVNAATRTALNATPNGTGYAVDLSVDGVSDWVSSAGATKLDTLTQFTLTCWINMRAAPANTDRLFGRIGATPFPGFDFLVGTPNVGVIGAGNFKLAAAIDTSTAVASTADMGANNEWKFVAVTYDGNLSTLNLLFYSGGTNVAVSQLGNAVTRNAGPVNTTTAEFRVGGTQATTADRTPPAWIDDVRVYDTVLSPTELEAVRREISNLPAAPGIISFGVGQQSGYVTGGSNLTISAVASGQSPLTFSFLRNSSTIPGTTTTTNASVASLAYSPGVAVPEHAGSYTLVVTNAVGAVTSAPVAFDVTAIFNTEVLTNIWSINAGSFSYLTTANSERGLAYCPVSANYPGGSLILPHYTALANRSIQVLNPADGSTGPTLLMTDLATFDMTNGARGLNMAAATAEGVIYIGNLTTSATNIGYYLYRYGSDDSATALPAIAYTGDPGGPSYAGLRWGDNMTLRGSGTATEILIASGAGANLGGSAFNWDTNVVSLLRTTDGTNFNATPIWITNAPVGFASLGVTFGPGTNTFYAKNNGYFLRLVEFDVDTGLGWVKQVYNFSAVPGSVSGIATDSSRTKLGAVSVETPDNFGYYDVSTTTQDPGLLDQEPFPTDNPQTIAGGIGVVAFGTNGVIYVLDSANAIKAFEVNTNYTQPSAFTISGITPNAAGTAVSWPGEANRTYQLQSRDDLTTGGWLRAGLPTVGTGGSLSVTNLFLGEPVNNRFYRVVGQ